MTNKRSARVRNPVIAMLCGLTTFAVSQTITSPDGNLVPMFRLAEEGGAAVTIQAKR